jgi:hypothetical protein
VHEVILDDRALDEKHPLWPISAYGAHKSAREKFVHSYNLGEGWPICALRPTGIYGLAHPPSASRWFDLVGRVLRKEPMDSARGGKEVHAADVRGQVELVGLTAGPVPWPIGKRGRVKAIAVFGALAEAIRREAAQVVAHFWGVGMFTVWKWRKALGVGAVNEGPRHLKRENYADHVGATMRAAAAPTLRSPARRAKIAAARRGKPRPRHVVEAVRKAHLGTTLSPETRKKMSEAHKRRGTRPPKAGRAWTAKEDRLVLELPPAEAAARTGRSMSAVYSRRSELRSR